MDDKKSINHTKKLINKGLDQNRSNFNNLYPKICKNTYKYLHKRCVSRNSISKVYIKGRRWDKKWNFIVNLLYKFNFLNCPYSGKMHFDTEIRNQKLEWFKLLHLKASMKPPFHNGIHNFFINKVFKCPSKTPRNAKKWPLSFRVSHG